MVQLPNTMGGSVCVPENGRVRCIPTLQSSRTPPGGIWKLKHLPGFEWRSILFAIYSLCPVTVLPDWKSQMVFFGSTNIEYLLYARFCSRF